jgi:hypothetical protein
MLLIAKAVQYKVVKRPTRLQTKHQRAMRNGYLTKRNHYLKRLRKARLGDQTQKSSRLLIAYPPSPHHVPSKPEARTIPEG